ncbi:protein phosphatase 2C domain-containing protein [Thiothrix subterranea]|uniref:PP2C family serine/threonine-protein phosphatase n=1 Tax=Thiothrix subterranea TaxID=2735563 RepID=UPI00192C6D66|nr:PP2C family serine/threonine-protein phosphatase [Thiothrix subterranea]QQZ28204.1 protein phosphatase 2C domain-containing protein [Thiothrix subterranea]
MKIKIVKNIMIGRGHSSSNMPCQDSVYTNKGKKHLGIAVSDGAGSKKLSGIGSKIAAKQSIGYVSSYFSELYDITSEKLIADKIRSHIIKHIRKDKLFSSNDINDYSCTLVFVVIEKATNRYIAGHIGDGLIISRSEQEAFIFSHPHNGEYSNTTFFITENDAIDNFFIYKGELSKSTGFMVMTDGTSSSLYDNKTKLPAPAINTIFGWLDNESERKVQIALSNAMKDFFIKKTHDDCSIAILSLI